jgi:hypothetical protein
MPIRFRFNNSDYGDVVSYSAADSAVIFLNLAAGNDDVGTRGNEHLIFRIALVAPLSTWAMRGTQPLQESLVGVGHGVPAIPLTGALFGLLLICKALSCGHGEYVLKLAYQIVFVLEGQAAAVRNFGVFRRVSVDHQCAAAHGFN